MEIACTHGEFTVMHSDYKMKQISAGGGTVKAKDAMKLSFDIVSNDIVSNKV
jgi:hypothetical protein